MVKAASSTSSGMDVRAATRAMNAGTLFDQGNTQFPQPGHEADAFGLGPTLVNIDDQADLVAEAGAQCRARNSMKLRSFVRSKWVDHAADWIAARSAVTGEPVALVPNGGIEMRDPIGYGRSAGGPNLRALTFHQRADLLKKRSASF
ncbi:hypothetical protein ACVIIW_004846 [Bradyrhizobium sp. USDA 4449]